MDKYIFYLVGLLDLDAHSRAVDTRFDQDLFAFVPGNSKWVEEDFRRAGGLNFGDIMPL